MLGRSSLRTSRRGNSVIVANRPFVRSRNRRERNRRAFRGEAVDGDRKLGERSRRHLGSRFLVPTPMTLARPKTDPGGSVSWRFRHQIGFSLLRRTLALADRRHSHRFRGVRAVPSGHSRLLYRRLRNTPRTRSSRVLLFPLDRLATSCGPGTLAQARGAERFGWRNLDC